MTLDIKIPDDVLESLPTNKAAMLEHLSRYFDEVIAEYETRFQRRAKGVLGGPLSRYEKATLKDFLMDMTIGKLRGESDVSVAPAAAAIK